jgi:hypothetical protein
VLCTISLGSCSTLRSLADPINGLDDQVALLQDKGVVAAKGEAVERSGRKDIARDKAVLDGTNQVARQFQVKVQSLTKSFSQSSGSNAFDQETADSFSRALSSSVNQVLSGVRQYGKVVYVTEGSSVRAGVVMGVDPKVANQAMIDQVKAADAAVFERFRGTSLYQKLVAEMTQVDQ